ncbi:MAG: nucleoside-diphosphate kinase [Chloroflexi bacterium]|nr:nucleoside-diphosphate kinase [Chloroflexota bacterium]
MERTLIIVKPDAMQRGLAGEVISRFERRGLRIAGLKLIKIDRALAERHYGEHVGKPFYEGLVSFITSSPVVVGVLEGPNAVQAVRNTMGATNPLNANGGTIRGDLAISVGPNLVHGSDSQQSAEREIGLFFRPEEMVDYQRDLERWLFE